VQLQGHEVAKRVDRGVDVEAAGESEVHGPDAPAGQSNQPVVEAPAAQGVGVDADREDPDAADEADEDAVDSRRARADEAVEEGEGQRGERLPAAPPGTGERGGADSVAEADPG